MTNYCIPTTKESRFMKINTVLVILWFIYEKWWGLNSYILEEEFWRGKI